MKHPSAEVSLYDFFPFLFPQERNSYTLQKNVRWQMCGRWAKMVPEFLPSVSVLADLVAQLWNVCLAPTFIVNVSVHKPNKKIDNNVKNRRQSQFLSTCWLPKALEINKVEIDVSLNKGINYQAYLKKNGEFSNIATWVVFYSSRCSNRLLLALLRPSSKL